MKVIIKSEIPVRLGKDVYTKGSVLTIKDEVYKRRPELYEVVEDPKPVEKPKNNENK